MWDILVITFLFAQPNDPLTVSFGPSALNEQNDKANLVDKRIHTINLGPQKKGSTHHGIDPR